MRMLQQARDSRARLRGFRGAWSSAAPLYFCMCSVIRAGSAGRSTASQTATEQRKLAGQTACRPRAACPVAVAIFVVALYRVLAIKVQADSFEQRAMLSLGLYRMRPPAACALAILSWPLIS